jgi:hypothetical protein
MLVERCIGCDRRRHQEKRIAIGRCLNPRIGDNGRIYGRGGGGGGRGGRGGGGSGLGG